MAPFKEPAAVVSFVTALLMVLLNVQETLQSVMGSQSVQEEESSSFALSDVCIEAQENLNLVAATSLHCYRLLTSNFALVEDFGFWVKPRSTAWFNRFVVDQYDDSRWVQHFRMTKGAVFKLAHILSPHILKKNTRYRLAIPVIVRVACTLFKLAQGASLSICSELFAVGVSTVSGMLYDTVRAINIELRREISWPTGRRLRETQADFKTLCGLPAVVGAIDGTHIHIAKPAVGPEDYFYFKSGGYTINCQAVVDSQKRFLDLYLGMPGSTNDARVLRRSSLHRLATQENFFDSQFSMDGFSPYLLGDSGYPLLPWLMVPHRHARNPSIVQALFNKKLRRGRGVVENAFGILKQTWRELLYKTELDVAQLPDVILTCALLHNLLLGQASADVDRLLQVLSDEGWTEELDDGECEDEMYVEVAPEYVAERVGGRELQQGLGMYLATQRGIFTE